MTDSLKKLLKFGCSFFIKENKITVRLYLHDKTNDDILEISKILNETDDIVHQFEVFMSGKNRPNNYDSNILQAFFKELSKFHSVEILTLDLSHNDISRLGSENIYHLFFNLRTLRNLKINLENSSLSDFDLKKITDGIQHLRKLKTLSMNLRKNKITRFGAKVLRSHFMMMLHIESLEIDLSNNDLDDQAIWDIISGILHIHNLKKLVFRCRGCSTSPEYQKIIRDSLASRVPNITLVF